MKQPVSRKIKGVKVKPRPVNNNTYNPKTGRITYGSNYEFDSNEDRDAFFNTYWNDAEKATTGSLIKPETLLSQAYVETLGGRNMPKNNMFGLTARKPEENPERYNVGIYETHEYFDTPDYYKTIDINGETFIDDEYKDKKLYGTELVTEGKNKGRYKYKVDRYFREYESIEEGMKGYIDNFSETSAYKSSMEELNSKPEDQKSFLKGISSSYSTSLGYDSPVIKNYDYFNKRADKRRMKNKLLYTDANIADNALKFKNGGFPYGNVEAEGRELVLRNSHGDMAIIPKKYRQEALDMIKEGCDGCLDNLISTLPKVKDYAKDGTVFGIPPNTFTAPSSTIQSANQNVNSNLIGKTREDIPQYNPGQTFIEPDNRTDYERQRNQEAMNAYQNPGFVGSLLSGARMVTRAVADPIQGIGQVFDAVGLGDTRIGQDLGNFNDEEAQYRYRNLNPNIDAGEKFMSNLGEGSEVAAYGATNFIPFESSVINPIVKGLVGKGNYSSYLANQLYTPVVNQGVKQVVNKTDDLLYTKYEDGLDFMKKWYNDPIIKEKYKITGYDDPLLMTSDEMFDSYNRNLNDYVDKNYNDLLKERGIKTYLKDGGVTNGLSYGYSSGIYVRKYPILSNRESVKVHELTHLIEINGNRLSIGDRNRLLEPFDINYADYINIPESKNKIIKTHGIKYFTDPTEIHARMNQARFDLGIKPGEKFTEDMFNLIDKKENWYGMSKYIKNKNKFIDLMNSFYIIPAVATAGAIGASQDK